MLPEWTIVSFSGHRKPGDSNTARAGVRAALELVGALRSPLAAISSAAPGGDTIFLSVANETEIPFFVLLPFTRDSLRERSDPEQWRTISPLLDKALTVEELPISDVTEPDYLECGVLCVDRSDVLIALWNGAPAKGSGGTADIVEYARATGKPLVLVNPATGALTTERMENLRELRSGIPAVDAGAHESVLLQYNELDKTAQTRRHSFIRIIYLNLLAQCFAVVPRILDWDVVATTLFSATELLLLVTAFLMTIRMKHFRHEWLNSRMNAELCRSFLSLWHLHRPGMRLPQEAGAATDSLYRSLTIAWHMDGRSVTDLASAREKYLRERIESQIEYFERNYRAVAPRFALLRKLVLMVTFAAIVTGILNLIMSATGQTGTLLKGLDLVRTLLPLVSAAALAQLLARDYARRAARHAGMLTVLTQARDRLRMTRSWAGLSRIALETEESLLRELQEWHSVSMFLKVP